MKKMMKNKNKKLEQARARLAEKQAGVNLNEFTILEKDQFKQLERAVVDLRDILAHGLTINNASDISPKEQLQSFGQKIGQLVEIIRLGVDVNNIDKIKIPEPLKTIEVTNLKEIEGYKDFKKDFDSLNKALQAINETLVKKGQEPEDYIPVRIVISPGQRLEFLQSFPIPSFGGGGGSSSSGGTVTLDKTGLATDTNQTNGSQKSQIVDGSGNVIGATNNAIDVNIKSGSSSGTQYTEGDTDTTITGTAMMMEGSTNTIVPAQGTTTDGLLVNLGSNNDVTVTGTVSASQSGTWNVTNISGTVSLPTGAATSAKQDTVIGHVDGIEGLLTTIDTDTGNIATSTSAISTSTGATSDAAATAGSTGSVQAKLRLVTSQLDSIKTAVEALDNTVSGSELQVDVLTMPTTTVTGTVTANAGSGTMTVDSELPAAAALGDGKTNPTAPMVGADLMAYNGSTWDAVRAGLGDGAGATGLLHNVGMLYNGSTYDRTRGDTTGLDTHVVPKTSGGLSVSHIVSAASTNATVVKASAGQLFGWYIYNSNASARKVAFHNSASTPTAGSSIFFTVVIPPTSGANVEYTNGIAFSSGIAVTMVTGLADSDSTAVAANDLVCNLFYK